MGGQYCSDRASSHGTFRVVEPVICARRQRIKLYIFTPGNAKNRILICIGFACMVRRFGQYFWVNPDFPTKICQKFINLLPWICSLMPPNSTGGVWAVGGLGKELGDRPEAGNSKSQIPNSKQIPNSQFQATSTTDRIYSLASFNRLIPGFFLFSIFYFLRAKRACASLLRPGHRTLR